MGSDCTVPIDDGLLNIRVGAIICRGNEFLMMENDKDPFLYSVGGRVKFGETAQEAIVREVLEETGTQMEIDRLGFVHENYFYLDEPCRENQVVYEISFYFYMKMPEDFSPVCESFTGSNPDGIKTAMRLCKAYVHGRQKVNYFFTSNFPVDAFL